MSETTPPLRSNLAAANIPGFFESVSKAFSQFVKAEGVPKGTAPSIVQSFPRERFGKLDDPFDVITYRVRSAEMAPTTNDGRTPYGPSLRETKPHPELMGYKLITYGWWEHVEVEFTVHSRSNARADALTDWFHRFLMKYAHAYKFFRVRGVEKFRFVAREDDLFDPAEGQEIYKRRLRYEFRLEILDAVMEKSLDSATVNVGVERQTDTIELSE